MKVKFKTAQFNGASPINEFSNIVEFKKYLNETLYYCEEIYMNIECNYTDNWKYSKTKDIMHILSEANFYDSILVLNICHELLVL